jgi:predicted PurR-regulated permease PerM
MKRLAQITAVVLATAIGALALWQMREAVQLLLVALGVASGLEPTVRTLTQRGLSRGLSITLAYIVGLATLALGILFFASLASEEVTVIIERLPVWYDQSRHALVQSGGWWRGLGASLPSADVLTASLVREQSDDMLSLAMGTVAGLLTFVTVAISAATLGFYWLVDRQRIERLWLSLLPLNTRTAARGVWGQVYDEVGVYVRGEAALVALSALALLSVYSALDVPGAGLLAALGGLAQVVPLLGIPIAILPGVLAALTQGPQTAGLTLGLTLYALGVIKLVIAPRVFNNGTNVNPVLVMFLIIALADIGGVWMILLAQPLAAAIQASLRILTSEQRAARLGDPVGAQALQEKLDALEAQIKERGLTDPRLADLLGRARRLVDEAANSLPDQPVDSLLPQDTAGARPA